MGLGWKGLLIYLLYSLLDLGIEVGTASMPNVLGPLSVVDLERLITMVGSGVASYMNVASDITEPLLTASLPPAIRSVSKVVTKTVSVPGYGGVRKFVPAPVTASPTGSRQGYGQVVSGSLMTPTNRVTSSQMSVSLG